MPYYKCRSCHHEFEYIFYDTEPVPNCDWCGADKPIMLEKKTPLEKLSDNCDELLKRIK